LPGNVRELENLLHRAVALSEEDELQIEPSTHQLLIRETAVTTTGPAVLDDNQITIPSDLQSHLDNAEREILIQALRESGFNRTAAAARLGLSLRQMRYRIARLHIDTPQTGDSSDEPV
jgi:two-component system response regulator PilR (NtrC family)